MLPGPDDAGLVHFKPLFEAADCIERGVNGFRLCDRFGPVLTVMHGESPLRDARRVVVGEPRARPASHKRAGIGIECYCSPAGTRRTVISSA
jgi:hypothetical protein